MIDIQNNMIKNSTFISWLWCSLSRNLPQQIRLIRGKRGCRLTAGWRSWRKLRRRTAMGKIICNVNIKYNNFFCNAHRRANTFTIIYIFRIITIIAHCHIQKQKIQIKILSHIWNWITIKNNHIIMKYLKKIMLSLTTTLFYQQTLVCGGLRTMRWRKWSCGSVLYLKWRGSVNIPSFC